MSLLREKDAQINHLKDLLYKMERTRETHSTAEYEGIINVLRGQIDSLKQENGVLLA